MGFPPNLTQLGLSQYEISAYLALVGHHPINGSQLSRVSGIPRARIYDVLRTLTDKGVAVEIGDGMYAPLPPEELTKRLRHAFTRTMEKLEKKIAAAAQPSGYDYVWTIRGYEKIMDKAKEMIAGAEKEIHARLFPGEGSILADDLIKAHQKGVSVFYISMGPSPVSFDMVVTHPDPVQVEAGYKGKTFDLVVDTNELLVGLFEKGNIDRSPVNWAKNHWFVVTTRDSLRHDYYHCMLDTLIKEDRRPTTDEQALYKNIQRDRK